MHARSLNNADIAIGEVASSCRYKPRRPHRTSACSQSGNLRLANMTAQQARSSRGSQGRTCIKRDRLHISFRHTRCPSWTWLPVVYHKESIHVAMTQSIHKATYKLRGVSPMFKSVMSRYMFAVKFSPKGSYLAVDGPTKCRCRSSGEFDVRRP